MPYTRSRGDHFDFGADRPQVKVQRGTNCQINTVQLGERDQIFVAPFLTKLICTGEKFAFAEQNPKIPFVSD